MPDSVLFDYLQLCCLVVMIREWGRDRLLKNVPAEKVGMFFLYLQFLLSSNFVHLSMVNEVCRKSGNDRFE